LKGLGTHILAEFIDCDSHLLNSPQFIKELLETAALKAGATIIESFFHQFNPHGVSGIVVIAESHLSIHTWPEFGFAAVDIFTCGQRVKPEIAFEYMKEKLKAQKVVTKKLIRGDSKFLVFNKNF